MRAPNQEAKRTGFCQAPFKDYLKMAQRPLTVIPAKAHVHQLKDFSGDTVCLYKTDKAPERHSRMLLAGIQILFNPWTPAKNMRG
ncbi:MAG TPA: hypothetical protein PKV86_12095 [Syntrophobacteraceae bacterium]|jgi:hypothetical protein|nr:hypothetical protein [Syntrophobacteraceae bacterium]